MKWSFNWGKTKSKTISNGDIEALQTSISSLTNQVTDLVNKYDSVNTELTTLKQSITNYVSNTPPVSLTMTQGNPPRITSPNNVASYLSYYRGNTELGYSGFGSSADTIYRIGNRQSGGVKFELKQSADNIDADSHKIVNVLTPTNNNDVAIKSYVDDKFNSIQAPDLSNYVTTSTLNNYTPLTTLNNYVTKTTLNNYVTNSALTSKLSTYATTTALANKQDAFTTSNPIIIKTRYTNNVAIGSSYGAFFYVNCGLSNANYGVALSATLDVTNSNNTTKRAFKILQQSGTLILIERSSSSYSLNANELNISISWIKTSYIQQVSSSSNTPSPLALDLPDDDIPTIELVEVKDNV